MNVSKSKRQFAADRFIPHRAGKKFNASCCDFAMDVFEMTDIWPEEQRVHTNYARKFLMRKRYLEGLKHVLDGSHTSKVLRFTENGESTDEDKYESEQAWPVKPRKEALIKHPKIILDTPTLDIHLCHNMIDWSKRNHIAVVYDGKVFIWRGEKEATTSVSKLGVIRQCLRFNRFGTKLAIALDSSQFIIMNLDTNKFKRFKEICCVERQCLITSFAWTKKGKLLSGCTNGKLTSWDLRENTREYVRGAHEGAIIKLEFSCGENYLASSALDKTIKIWNWPDLNCKCTFVCSLSVKTFAWHPWKEPLIVCSIDRSSDISLWNIHNYKEVCRTVSASDTSIDCITFNKRSGELVASFYNASVGKTFVAVITNFTTLNDGIIWHLGKVPYLLWNGDSTQLLTAGSDEYVCIWEFFGENEKSVPKMRKDGGSVSDRSLKFNFFQHCIR